MAPRSKQRLLHGVLRVVKGPQNSLAMDVQLADIARRQGGKRRVIACRGGRELRRLRFSASINQGQDHTLTSRHASVPSRHGGRELLFDALRVLQQGGGHVGGGTWVHILEPAAYRAHDA